MHISAILSLLIICLVQISSAQWWGDDSNERFDDDDYSPFGYGRRGRQRRFINRWGSDEDDDDDDWNRARLFSRGFNRMAPRRNSWGRQQRPQQRSMQGGWSSNRRSSQGGWSSPNYLSGLWMMRDYDTPDFFDFFG